MDSPSTGTGIRHAAKPTNATIHQAEDVRSSVSRAANVAEVGGITDKALARKHADGEPINVVADAETAQKRSAFASPAARGYAADDCTNALNAQVESQRAAPGPTPNSASVKTHPPKPRNEQRHRKHRPSQPPRKRPQTPMPSRHEPRASRLPTGGITDKALARKCAGSVSGQCSRRRRSAQNRPPLRRPQPRVMRQELRTVDFAFCLLDGALCQEADQPQPQRVRQRPERATRGLTLPSSNRKG